jgi:hypothetical protein
VRKIHKFELKIADYCSIQMPVGAKVLTVANQRNHLCIWAEVHVDAGMETRRFAIRGTGHHMQGDEGRFIGSVMFRDGDLVFHVFEAR